MIYPLVLFVPFYKMEYFSSISVMLTMLKKKTGYQVTQRVGDLPTNKPFYSFRDTRTLFKASKREERREEKEKKKHQEKKRKKRLGEMGPRGSGIAAAICLVRARV